MAALAQSLLTSEQDAERRSETRYPTQYPAELELLPGPAEPIYGTVLDVSRSGLRVALPRRVDRGAQEKPARFRSSQCQATAGVSVYQAFVLIGYLYPIQWQIQVGTLPGQSSELLCFLYRRRSCLFYFEADRIPASS